MKRIICLILSALLLSLSACRKDNLEEDSFPVYSPEITAVEGLFSVAPGQQVMFASGNVLYMPFFRYWRIADEQYRICAQANENGYYRYSGWLDLFGWGTAHAPLLRSLDTSDYVSFSDWGGCFGKEWRTLGEEEWDYLLYSRNGASRLYTTAVVCGVKGLLLFPDEWECPGGITLQYADFSFSNSINERQIHRMEEAGAVFLPSAGYRQGDDYQSGFLCYWTSTSVGVPGFEGMRVFLDITPSDSFVGLKGMSSYCGLAVRLAKNVNP